jgi:uncharacterized Zn finger protein
MKLKEIENSLDPIILERGERYRENGQILSFEEVGPRLYRAEVEGNELYDVEVHLGSRGEVYAGLSVCSQKAVAKEEVLQIARMTLAKYPQSQLFGVS